MITVLYFVGKYAIKNVDLNLTKRRGKAKNTSANKKVVFNSNQAQKVDILIGLGHIGYDQDKILAEKERLWFSSFPTLISGTVPLIYHTLYINT
jgi:hypothetical protein